MKQATAVYYPALTGLRMVAASLVFMGHHAYILSGAPVRLRQLVEGSYVGVSLFFVLSGFLIARQYFHHPIHSFPGYLRYLGVRLARIFPFYWLVLYGLYVQWLFGLPELLLHASLLKGFFAPYQLAGIVQAWTLTTELTFYGLAPLLFWFIRTRGLAQTWGATILVGIMLAGLGGALERWNLNPLGFVPDLENMAWYTFFGRATEFFAGIHLFCFLTRSSLSAPKAPGLIPVTYAGGLLFLGIAAGISLLSTTNPGVATWPGLLLHHLLLPVSIWLLLYGLVVEETRLGKLLARPLFVALGNASYVFYLIHLGWLRNWAVNQVTTSVPLLFGMMWALAWGLHCLLERPLYRWLKSRISGQRV